VSIGLILCGRLDRIEQRAFVRRMLRAACIGQLHQGFAHALQLGQLPVETSDPTAGAAFDGGAAAPWCDTQGQEAIDLLERETESLRALDECYSPAQYPAGAADSRQPCVVAGEATRGVRNTARYRGARGRLERPGQS
jgi:hypothetical protein